MNFYAYRQAYIFTTQAIDLTETDRIMKKMR